MHTTDELQQTNDHLLAVGLDAVLHLLESGLSLTTNARLNVLLRAEVLLLVLLELTLALLRMVC